MTAAIFFPSNLPPIISTFMSESWKRQIAEDFMDVNVLCGQNIKASLVNESLFDWSIDIAGNTTSCNFLIHFQKEEKILLDTKLVTNIDKHILSAVKLKAMHLLKTSSSMYEFSNDMYSFLS